MASWGWGVQPPAKVTLVWAQGPQGPQGAPWAPLGPQGGPWGPVGAPVGPMGPTGPVACVSRGARDPPGLLFQKKGVVSAKKPKN